jgi:hypothetical protein
MGVGQQYATNLLVSSRHFELIEALGDALDGTAKPAAGHLQPGGTVCGSIAQIDLSARAAVRNSFERMPCFFSNT